MGFLNHAAYVLTGTPLGLKVCSLTTNRLFRLKYGHWSYELKARVSYGR